MPHLTLQCKNKHIFKINYNKKLANLSCLECKISERNTLKEKMRIEEEQRAESCRIHQERLFARAKQEMKKDFESNPNNNWNRNCNNGNKTFKPSYYSSAAFPDHHEQDRLLESQIQLEQAINSQAIEYTNMFLSKCSEPSLSPEKVYCVYKMSLTDQTIIAAYIESLGSLEKANSYFRKIALLLHPDKNCHPLAEQVFKKINQAFDCAKATLKMRYN